MASLIDNNYATFLEQLKERVATSRHRVSRAVNSELILLYHHIGSEILKQQAEHGWGAKIIEHLGHDLRMEFPGMKGFSSQNMKYMKKFAQEYSEEEIRQHAVDQLPWGHNIILIYSISDKNERFWYVKKALSQGWSRNILSMHIETHLYKREGKATTNFQNTLPSPQSDLAQSLLKDPYIFDFLTIDEKAHEREIENTLTTHIEKFLLELGEGFACVGRQYHLAIEKQDFYIDLLFYHLKLRSYIVIDLKTGVFQPEHAGKMNFYLSAVDDLIRQPGDNPSIGLVLCRSKTGIVAEYALRDMAKPIGLAEYRFTEMLPDNLKTALPTIEELEAELSKNLTTLDT